MHDERVAARAIVMQQKTQRPVQFEITEQTRDAVTAWIYHQRLKSEDFLFPSRLRAGPGQRSNSLSVYRSRGDQHQRRILMIT